MRSLCTGLITPDALPIFTTGAKGARVAARSGP